MTIIFEFDKMSIGIVSLCKQYPSTMTRVQSSKNNPLVMDFPGQSSFIKRHVEIDLSCPERMFQGSLLLGGDLQTKATSFDT